MKNTRHTDDTTRLEPWRALLTPTWAGALAVMVLNDHALKTLAAGPVTGKLSDVAGLFLTPALLATLVGARRQRSLWACAAAIGAVFATINLWPAAAQAWDGLMSAGLFPFHTTPDPTDLMALPALAAGAWWAARAGRPALVSAPSRRAAWALACVGALACAGSGFVQPVDQEDPPDEFNGMVTILNKTHEMHELEIRQLNNNVLLDCNVIAEDPLAMLDEDLFNGGASWIVPLFSGEELAVDPTEWNNNWQAQQRGNLNSCRAFVVRAPVLPEILVFWRGGTMEQRTYVHNAWAPKELEASSQTIVIEADYRQVPTEQLHEWREITCPVPEDQWDRQVEWAQCDQLSTEELDEAARIPQGARYSWRSVFDGAPLHYERPRFEPGEPIQTPARCQTPGPGESLAWENPPRSQRRLVGLQRGVDGCHTLLFEDQSTWLVCAPWEAIERLDPEERDIAQEPIMLRFDTSQQFNRSEELRIIADQDSLDLGFREMVFLTGSQFGGFSGITWEEEIRSGCAPIKESCDEVSLPVDLRITSTSEDLLVEPGESVELGLSRQFYLVRAGYRPIVNQSCAERMNHESV